MRESEKLTNVSRKNDVMKEQILKAIKERTNFQQHQTQYIKTIIDNEAGTEDITSRDLILSRVAYRIVCCLKNINLVNELTIRDLYKDILVSMGVYDDAY